MVIEHEGVAALTLRFHEVDGQATARTPREGSQKMTIGEHMTLGPRVETSIR